MRTFITAILCVNVCLTSNSTSIQIDDIPTLSIFNYAQAIQESERTVIYFDASDRYLREEFLNFANKKVQTGAVDIKFYKMDYSYITMFLLTVKYSLAGPFDFLYFLHRGEIVIPYALLHNLLYPIEWLEHISGSGSEQVKTVSEVEKLVKKRDVIAIFFGPTDSKVFLNFTHVGHLYDNVPGNPVFAHTNEQAIMDKFDVTTTETLAIVKKREETKFYTGLFEIKSIQKFIDAKGLPKILSLQPRMKNHFYKHELNVLFLFTVNNEGGIKAEDALLAASSSIIKDVLTLVIADKDDFYSKEYMDILDVPRNKIPEVRIIQFGHLQGRYDFEKDITAENLIEFVNDYKNNRLKVWFRSDPIPAEPFQDGVRIVVGQNFEEVVMDETSDVLITLVDDDDLERAFKLASLSPRFRNIPGLVIALIDVSYNPINGIPRDHVQIYLYPKGRKDKPIRYSSSEMSEKDIIEFLRKRANVRSPEHGLTGLNFAEKIIWFILQMMPFLNIFLPLLGEK